MSLDCSHDMLTTLCKQTRDILKPIHENPNLSSAVMSSRIQVQIDLVHDLMDTLSTHRYTYKVKIESKNRLTNWHRHRIKKDRHTGEKKCCSATESTIMGGVKVLIG